MTLFTDKDSPDPRVTHMLTQWGQFLDHDITLTPEVDKPPLNDADIGCDTCDDSKVPDHCFNIKIPPNDTTFKKKGLKCLEFHRYVLKMSYLIN